MLTPAPRPASMSARASRGARHYEIPKWEFLLRNESTLRAPTYATIRSFMGWTMGFEPTTTGITRPRFRLHILKNQELPKRTDARRRARNAYSSANLSTVRMASDGSGAAAAMARISHRIRIAHRIPTPALPSKVAAVHGHRGVGHMRSIDHGKMPNSDRAEVLPSY
jgi:hypothetical protein